MVILHIKDFGDIKIQLDYENAPISCANFVSLVKSGFYNGLKFHRIIKGFMIQGGDPEGNGTGGPGYSIKGEFAHNGVENNLSHRRGTVSMARAQDPNSAGSQFFICDNNKDKFLDGDYAAFGTVTKGMDVVDKIASTPTNSYDFPMKQVVIESAEAIDEPDNEFEKIQ
jgi:peptidyl-prolyl cis-trans isomerase B (cyclophilin B)